MQPKLEYIEHFNQPDVKPTAVVIWLHGLGSSYDDFMPVVPELQLNYSAKFIFPNAPMRPITLNGGYVMRAWYDLHDLNNSADSTDISGINQSVEQIEELIAKQISLGFPASKIIIAGFSQGGAISYITGLNTKYQLGGILVLSGYLPAMPTNIESSVNKATPFFAIHGTEDAVVTYKGGLHAYQELKNHDYNIQWAEYPIAHSVCLEEIQAIGVWLDTILQN